MTTERRGGVRAPEVGAMTAAVRAPHNGEEGPQEGRIAGPEEVKPGVLSHHQPLGHRHHCRVLWVTSTAQLLQGVTDPRTD